MGQGTWGMDEGDDGAEDDMRYLEQQRRIKDKRFRNAVKAEVSRQLNKKRDPALNARMVDRVCACGCGAEFRAREADVKRGWGKFSSKSCAAKYKDVRSGGKNRGAYGS